MLQASDFGAVYPVSRYIIIECDLAAHSGEQQLVCLQRTAAELFRQRIGGAIEGDRQIRVPTRAQQGKSAQNQP
jgi:hypothetical protein